MEWDACVFLCAVSLHLRFPLTPACRPRLALSGSSQRSAPNLKGFCNQTSGETRMQKVFFFFSFFNTGQRRKEKKILQLKWGNSANEHLSPSNPVTIAKKVAQCKHGNRLLIWMSLTGSGCVQLRYRPTAASVKTSWEKKMFKRKIHAWNVKWKNCKYFYNVLVCVI